MLIDLIFFSKVTEKSLHLGYSVCKKQSFQKRKKYRSQSACLLQNYCTFRGIVLKPSILEPQVKYIVEVNWADRWQIYRRLQELDIPCSCEANQPLKVEMNNTTAAVQLWSVVRQSNSCRQDLISVLNKCWQHRT